MESGPMPESARKRPSRSGSAAMKPSAVTAKPSAAACRSLGFSDRRRSAIALSMATHRRVCPDMPPADAGSAIGSRLLAPAPHLRARRARVKSLDAGAACRLVRADIHKETAMRKGGLSIAGASILFALGLAAWEVYFFWFAGSFPEMDSWLGLFSSERLGFNMAWLAALYLTFQLISIPFSLPAAGNRFTGVLDGMASLVPLAVVL